MVVVAVVDVGDDEDDDGYDDVVVGCAPSYARRPFDTRGDGFFPVLNTPRCKTRAVPLAGPLLLFLRQRHSDGPGNENSDYREIRSAKFNKTLTAVNTLSLIRSDGELLRHVNLVVTRQPFMYPACI